VPAARKQLARRESVLEDSHMLISLDLETLPRKMVALRGLLLQREADHAAAREQQAAALQQRASELERRTADPQVARMGLQE
jgi:hypothetical protein